MCDCLLGKDNTLWKKMVAHPSGHCSTVVLLIPEETVLVLLMP